jgi:hypothetical protein
MLPEEALYFYNCRPIYSWHLFVCNLYTKVAIRRARPNKPQRSKRYTNLVGGIPQATEKITLNVLTIMALIRTTCLYSFIHSARWWCKAALDSPRWGPDCVSHLGWQITLIWCTEPRISACSTRTQNCGQAVQTQLRSIRARERRRLND